ncbi:hypothetical protein Sjap_013035 [Stephania japonica]|uniref:Sodium/calcium exchanger membrane region domain-containing protein n=1 Tax=Stephania japonica TaxID=461633 RepID=A0AAP0IXD4_9MAGN
MALHSSKNYSYKKKFTFFLNTSFLFILSFYLVITLVPPTTISHNFNQNNHLQISHDESKNTDGCSGINEFHDYQSKCDYVRSNKGCASDGYIDYLHLFYCNCGSYPSLGYTVLLLWLLVLFYLLGNTAAIYFCSSLESLSSFLKLSPTIAGVTLLSLGNGAPDVFSSLVSFTKAGTGEVGLNSVLGGALFVSTVVIGIISISIGPRQVPVNKPGFIRDVVFFLLALGFLLLIVIMGHVNLWGALGFLSLYFVYVFIVWTSHDCKESVSHKLQNILPLTRTLLFAGEQAEGLDSGELRAPLLGFVGDGDDEKPVLKGGVRDRSINEDFDKATARWYCCIRLDSLSKHWDCFARFLYILELPLYLPRRLTIPVVSEERWSKPFAVASVTFAPILLATLWNSYVGNMGSRESLIVFLISALIGLSLGTTAFFATEMSNPPRRCLFPWLGGGFLMSVIWTYIIAEELVALLVSLGTILEISPSILGLTLLAWGNSLGDLIANVAMSVNGEADNVQIAISGCYAGPIFNTIIGLGLSLVFSSWSNYPSSFVIPSDPYIFETLGFLAGGLLWALIILPRKDMKPDRILGGGLLAIYLCFLSVRLSQILAVVPLN